MKAVVSIELHYDCEEHRIQYQDWQVAVEHIEDLVYDDLVEQMRTNDLKHWAQISIREED